MKTLCVIPCSKTKKFKKNEFLQAQVAYNGTTFNYSKNICLKEKNNFIIFSAKYGLIYPEKLIENYNISFNNKEDRCVSYNIIDNQFQDMILGEYDNIMSFCGNNYNKYLFKLCKEYKIVIIDFFEELEKRGMGYKLNFLKVYHNNLNKNINDIF